jgi:transposase
LVVTVRGMSYPSDLTDGQWALLEPVFDVPGKRVRKHANDLRTDVDAMLYIARTGCQWRYLPESFGPWTRVWSQFRRCSRNGTWARSLVAYQAPRTVVDTSPFSAAGPGTHSRNAPVPWTRITVCSSHPCSQAAGVGHP